MTAQEKSKILKALAEELRIRGTFYLCRFTPFLRDNVGLSSSLYGGMGPKSWLEANFPEIKIEGDPGKETLSLSPTPFYTPTQKSLPASVRASFVATLSEHLETYGMVLHASIPGIIPDWTKYRDGNEKLGVWLARVFSEDVFTSRPVNNAMALFTPQAAADIDQIVAVTGDMIRATGIATVAEVSAQLEARGLHWESIPVAHNQTLGEWLMDYCTGIVFTDASQTALRFAPDNIDLETATITNTIKQTVVYRYVFLPVSGTPLNALREILKDPTYSTAQWKKQSVDVCFDNLMGLGHGFLDDSDSAEPKMAFDTGLQTPEGQHVYCILVPNDVESAVQRWRGNIFRYPGQNDPEGYGKWLCQRFGIPSENLNTVSAAYRSISEAAEEIDVLREALSQQLTDVSACIAQGNPVPSDFCSRLAQYTAQWDAVLNAMHELGVSIPDERTPISCVKELLENKDNASAILEEIEGDYHALVVAAWKFMDEEVGALNADAMPDRDLAQWSQRFATVPMIKEEIQSAITELLAPFYAIRTLTTSTLPLTDAEKRAWDMVEKHFDASIRAKDIKERFIGARDDAKAFLDKINEIEKDLARIQIQKDSAPQVVVPVLEDEDVVRQAIINTGNINLIHRHYPAANTLEAAVACADFASVRAIVQDTQLLTSLGYTPAQQEAMAQQVDKLSCNFTTPLLTAGLNLLRLQDNANRQAEKFLLLAISLKDGDATGYLADQYYFEGKVDLLAIVYDAYSQNFAAQPRQQYMRLLIDHKHLRIRDVLEQDLQGFLSIEDTTTMDSFCNSSQLAETDTRSLMLLRQGIEEPFIRQIVFLDSELYRFSQQQENIENICELGIQHTMESLAELLRSGKYPRGRDALSVARRIWYFVKDWRALAEAVASLAEDTLQKAEFLWEIFSLREDCSKMLQLMREVPQLQTNNPNAYSELLYNIQSYQEYCDAYSEVENPNVRMKLQFLVASLYTDSWDETIPEDLDPAELANAADITASLTALLVDKGQIEAFNQFILRYFEPLLLHCGAEVAKQIVLADGKLQECDLLQLQERAIEGNAGALAIFLFRLLGNENTEAYKQYYRQIVPELVRNKLNEGQQPEDAAKAVAAQMLTEEWICEDNLTEILTILKDFSVICEPAVLEKLLVLCQIDALQEESLQFFHAHADTFNGKADHILCRLYQKALTNGTLPDTYLEEAERIALRQLRNYQDNVAARCVCIIEERRGRVPYSEFARLFVQGADTEDPATELDLFRQILEDAAMDMDEYLRFCKNFGLFSDQDQASIGRLLRSGEEGTLTEAESIPLLHGLYLYSDDPDYIKLSARLPLRDDPAVYARLLCYGARRTNGDGISWRKCLDYCEKNRLDDLLMEILLKAMERAIDIATRDPRWYHAKDSFDIMLRLCNRPEGFPEIADPAHIRQLLDQMCTFFLKIDQALSDSINHNSLRTIIEAAVATQNEDIVMDRLPDKLLGVYTKLGLVLACRLLKHSRYEGARDLFVKLSRCHNQIVYKKLIDMLAQMDCGELESWAKKSSSQMLLDHFILPDGNRPDVQTLRHFVMDCITGGKQQAGIEVAELLTSCFETDSICYKILFILCKENYADNMLKIQHALSGLYAYYPEDRRSFYTRSRDNMLTRLTTISAVLQQQQDPNAIADIGAFIREHSVLGPGMISDTVMAQTTNREKILSGFVGLDAQQSALMVHGLMAAVTGNWVVFLRKAFLADITSRELAMHLKRYLHYDGLWGLLRGFLRAYHELEEAAQSNYLHWVKEAIEHCADEEKLSRVLDTAITIIGKNANFLLVDPEFLELPWEEHLICLPNTKAGEVGILDSCYMWMMNHLSDDPENATNKTTLHVFYRLAQDKYRARRIFNDAGILFRHGEFSKAAELYDFLIDVQAIPRNVQGMPKSEKQRYRSEYRELYQSSSRICKFFLGEENFLGENQNPHSCANLIVTLLQSPHADELPKISRFFTDSNRQLCKAILAMIDPDLSDAEKEAIYDEFPIEDGVDPIAKLVLAWTLSTMNIECTEYLFVQNQTLGRSMATAYETLQEKCSRSYTLLKFGQRVNKAAHKQVIADPETHDTPQDSTDPDNSAAAPSSRTERPLPAFALQAYAEMQDDTLPALDSLREAYKRCDIQDYSSKLYYARAIYYTVSSANKPDAAQTVVALLTLGKESLDYQRSLLSQSDTLSAEEKKQLRKEIRETLLQLAYYSNSTVRRSLTGAPVILYADTLKDVLCNDFASVDELVNEFKRNFTDYQILLQCIDNEDVQNIAKLIFDQISRLVKSYEDGGPKEQHGAFYRSAYQSAYDALTQIPHDYFWNEAKNSLVKLLTRAINDLDNRPYLDIKLLNKDSGNRNGIITGVLTNTGRVAAEKITLQVFFQDNSSSDVYGYDELKPNEQVCFAVQYSAGEDSATLSYRLNISYFHKEKEYIADPREGTLELTEDHPMTPDVDRYGAHKSLVFTTDEDGNVVSKGFYGREVEKKALRMLAPENAAFCDYRAAVIQGFRRTGKTSLLHYFREHVRSKCSDTAVVLYVDCEGFTNQPIQKAFVSSVLYGLENEMPELAEKESWHRFRNRWELPSSEIDVDADKLQHFYTALGRELGGRGVVLILDEADRLFGRIEEVHGTAGNFFPALRAVRHNPDCQKAICMLMCGSNNMLIYNQDGGKLYQLFEDFAKIPVGRLHKEETEQLLLERLEETGEMEFHPEALEWIWRYTGGLVWYTKLLGNAAVNHAKNNGRRVIYPIDVSIAFDSIVNEQNCKQYISEGCDDDAKLVLDAIATCTPRYGTEVPRSQLVALLDGMLTESQLDASLSLLTDTLGLLERSVNARNTYHFAVELYRRFYRTQPSLFSRTEAPVDRMKTVSFSSTHEDLQRRFVQKRN